MESIVYYYWTFAITIVYIFFLVIQGRYKLILPSLIHTSIWMVTSLLVILQLKGILVTRALPENAVNLVSQFTCYLVIASIIGFTCAHYVTERYENNSTIYEFNLNEIDDYLHRFRWIPYLCGITGLLLFIFLITTIGDFSSFSDYRILALQTKRVGYAAIAQRISGHINILGSFYLMLLGYRSGKKGIDIKEFLKFSLLCSAINISIGGRVWILTSLLPFFTTYVLSKYNSYDNAEIKSDKKKIILILFTFISLFSVIGILRNTNTDSGFFDKFLYLTDGTRMTNMVLNKFPESTYPLEYGASTILSGFIQSPMATRFMESISYDIGLSVTVKSVMPYLYYDYGFIGGVIFWGIICFFIEVICIRMKYSNTIIGLILFGTLSTIFIEAPVGNIFSNKTPTFEWILLLFLIRKYIIKSNGIENKYS